MGSSASLGQTVPGGDRTAAAHAATAFRTASSGPAGIRQVASVRAGCGGCSGAAGRPGVRTARLGRSLQQTPEGASSSLSRLTSRQTEVAEQGLTPTFFW